MMTKEAIPLNTALYTQRKLRGWSQAKLAELIGASEEMISKWERGKKRTSPFYQEKLCDLFGMNAEELGFLLPALDDASREAPALEMGSDLNLPMASNRDTIQSFNTSFMPSSHQQKETRGQSSYAIKQGILEAMRELVGEDMDQQRRQILQQILNTIGTALLVPADGLLGFSEQTSTIHQSGSLLRLYEYLLSLSWEHYYMASSQSLPSIINDCLHSLTNTAQEAHGNEQIHLLALLCRFHQLSGVVARDRMDITRALSDGKKSIELAFSVENAELIASSLFRRAKTYLKQQQYDKAFPDLEAALSYARRSRDPLRGYVHQATAEAYMSIAFPQDQDMQRKSLNLLDSVEALLHNGNLDDDGSFVKVNIAGLSMDRARVLTRFQKPREARQTLVVAHQHLGTELTRWRSRLLIADAEIYLAENDIQGCCQLLFDALKIVRATNSRSNEMRIGVLHQKLHAHSLHHALVTQLGEQLRES